MRWSILFALPFIGGCVAPAFQPEATSVAPPVSATRPAASSGASARTAQNQTVTSALKPRVGGFFPDFSEIPSFAEEDLSSYSDDEYLPEDIPDAETLTDNLLLSGVGEDPPEDEGLTIASDISFDFPVVENEKVHYYIDYFTGPVRKVFTRWLERSGRYVPLMESILQEEGLPLDLTYLAMVESGFNERAYSWAHAVGPWQFIQSTGKLYGMESDWWHDERRDFEKSTRAAARFLKHLHERFDGDWYLAIASYNCGPGRVERAIEKSGSRDFWELSRQNLLPEETRNYVPKMLAALIIGKQAERFGFERLEYMEPVVFDTVTVPAPIDLDVVARICSVPTEEVKNLNPELKRWCTPPGKAEYRLRIPAGTREDFEAKYAALPKHERVSYRRHQVRRGDTLKSIARKYHTRVADLVALNEMGSSRSLRAGDEIILPLKEGAGRAGNENADEGARTRKVTYKVRKGDSLWSISRQFGVSEKDLRALNRLSRKSTLRAGQKLTVVAAAASTQHKSKKADRETHQVTYRVRSGDSLWTIARRFNVTTSQLRTWNGLSKRHVLRPGDKITVVAAQNKKGGSQDARKKIVYRVKQGDTLWDISRRYDVAAQEILDLNNLSESDVLKPGDKLTLMVGDGFRG